MKTDQMISDETRLRELLHMIYKRLNMTEVCRVVTIDGPSDPKRREGSAYYRVFLTIGEKEDIENILRNE